MELNLVQIVQLTAVRDMITAFLGPPAGQPPQDMKVRAEQYIVDHLACTPAEFDAAFTTDFFGAALVDYNTQVDPSGGSEMDDGTPVGVAEFHAKPTDDSVVDVKAFGGTNNLPSIRHAITNNKLFVGKDTPTVKTFLGIAVVWGWKNDGSVWNLKTNKRIAEGVIVTGTSGTVLIS
jgi:hypothetical protein